jgi:hypothetical protein
MNNVTVVCFFACEFMFEIVREIIFHFVPIMLVIHGYVVAINFVFLFTKITFSFFCRFAPFGYLYFSYFSMNEPELGAGIDPGMAFNPFPSSILDKTRFKPTTFRS